MRLFTARQVGVRAGWRWHQFRRNGSFQSGISDKTGSTALQRHTIPNLNYRFLQFHPNCHIIF